MASPGLSAVVARAKARERNQRQMSGRQSNGDSLQTGLVASVAMASTRRRGQTPSLGRIFAAVAFALGAGAVSVPEAPSKVDLDVINGNEVAVAFSAPLSDGGSAVQSYEVCAAAVGVGFCCRRSGASEQDTFSNFFRVFKNLKRW